MTRLRLWSLARSVCLASALSLSSCFTMTLWGLESEENPLSRRDETYVTGDRDAPSSWELFAWRVLGTPFALALDCLTMPIQAFLQDDDEDDVVYFR